MVALAACLLTPHSWRSQRRRDAGMRKDAEIERLRSEVEWWRSWWCSWQQDEERWWSRQLQWQQNKDYKNEGYILPEELDEEVTGLYLPALGAELTTLSKEQADGDVGEETDSEEDEEEEVVSESEMGSERDDSEKDEGEGESETGSESAKTDTEEEEEEEEEDVNEDYELAEVSEACPNGHGLKRHRADAEYTCDGCGRSMEGTKFLDCRKCDFSLCLSCAGMDAAATSKEKEEEDEKTGSESEEEEQEETGSEADEEEEEE